MVLNVDASCFVVRRRVFCTRRCIRFRDIVVSAVIANMVKFCYSSKSSCNLENRLNSTDTDRIEIHLYALLVCSDPLPTRYHCVCVLFVIRFTVVFILFTICYKVIGARPLSIHGVVLFWHSIFRRPFISLIP